MTSKPAESGFRVSVIIPVLNNAETIGEAIQGALTQSRPPDEIIVVDDGSTDGSGDIAAAFGDPVRVIYQETQGIGGARNHGIRESTGDVITLLDADDLWLPHKTERQLGLLQPAIDVVGGWVAQVPEADWDRALREGAPRSSWMPGPIGSAVLMRRTAFDRVGLFGSYRAGEFIDWYSRARDGGLGIATVEEVLTLRRIHGENYGVRHPEVYAESYLAVARAALARRHPDSSGGGTLG